MIIKYKFVYIILFSFNFDIFIYLLKKNLLKMAKGLRSKSMRKNRTYLRNTLVAPVIVKRQEQLSNKLKDVLKNRTDTPSLMSLKKLMPSANKNTVSEKKDMEVEEEEDEDEEDDDEEEEEEEVEDIKKKSEPVRVVQKRDKATNKVTVAKSSKQTKSTKSFK